MKRLLQFIKKGRFLFLFLFLEGIGLALTLGQYKYHKSVVMDLSGDVSYSLIRGMNSWTTFLSMSGENKRLATENAALRAMLSIDDKQNITDSILVRDSLMPYSYIAAKVIRNSFIDLKNYVVLNRGAKHGVEIDQGVATPNGILGVIVQVSDSYSVCRSVLHLDSHLSARFKKNEFFGTVEWDGKHRLFVDLINIPREAPVSKGDTIITDRRSTLFPEGIPIGVVDSVSTSQMSDFHNIKIRLANDPANISYVYIIDYKFDKELSQIQKQIDGQNPDK